MEKKYEINRTNHDLLMAVLFYNKHIVSKTKRDGWCVLIGISPLMSVNKAMHVAFSNKDAYEIYYLIETRNGLKSDRRFAGRKATIEMVFNGIQEMLEGGEIVVID